MVCVTFSSELKTNSLSNCTFDSASSFLSLVANYIKIRKKYLKWSRISVIVHRILLCWSYGINQPQLIHMPLVHAENMHVLHTEFAIYS